MATSGRLDELERSRPVIVGQSTTSQTTKFAGPMPPLRSLATLSSMRPATRGLYGRDEPNRIGHAVIVANLGSRAREKRPLPPASLVT